MSRFVAQFFKESSQTLILLLAGGFFQEFFNLIHCQTVHLTPDSFHNQNFFLAGFSCMFHFPECTLSSGSLASMWLSQNIKDSS